MQYPTQLYDILTNTTDLSIAQADTEADVDTDTDTEQSDGPYQDISAMANPDYTETLLQDESVTQLDGWVGSSTLQAIDDDHISTLLDEILLMLVSVRGQATGKELSSDLTHVFGATFSSGTIYPRLDALAEERLLEVRDLPRWKVYSIADRESVSEKVCAEVEELLELATVLHVLADECTDTPNTQDN